MSLDPETEERLWNRLHEESIGKDQPDRMVRIGNIARQELPCSLESAKQTVRKWDNNGLVQSFSGGMRAILTSKGKETETLHLSH